MLSLHKRRREKGPGTIQLLAGALKASRLFQALGESQAQAVIDIMEHYVFDKNEFIVKEGDLGTHVFVSFTQGLEVVLCGASIGELPRGRAFGELALFSGCPRSVSIVAAQSGCGVFAAPAGKLRQAVHESMLRQVGENREFIDSIPMFESLSVRQRDTVCDASRLITLEPGTEAELADSEAKSIFFLKAGDLTLRDLSHPGAKEGGALAPPLAPGDGIGERALLYGEPFAVVVHAVSRCEILRVDVAHLRQALGNELKPIRLQRSFLLANLKRSGALHSLSQAQQLVAIRAMEFQELGPNQQISKVPPFFHVEDGLLRLGEGGQVFRRGQWHGIIPLAPANGSKPPPGRGDSDSPAKGPLIAGSTGCRLAVLTARGISIALEELGMEPAAVGCEDEENNSERMALIISKVCVFRHLPRQTLLTLASGVSRRTYKQDDVVIRQGAAGYHFFIVVSGEVEARSGDQVLRTMVKYGYFGERALLLDEPRAATIVVTTAQSEIWAIDKGTFIKVVRDRTQTSEQVLNRIWLQDYGIAFSDLSPVEVIGSGTSGMVQLVQNQKTGFRYALKRVAKTNSVAYEVAMREIEVLHENDHPFIMHLVKTFEFDKSFYMLSEYCSGGELHAAIRTISHVLSRRQAAFYTGSLLLMLEALHDRHVVYRDLKPENIMLDSQGYLKLIDFGTAKKLEKSCPRTYTLVGTPHYMAPEVILGKGYGTEVDVWALGVILYELMVGYMPFGDDLDPSESHKVCQAVLHGEPTFPTVLDRSAKDLIENLLVQRPSARLGCGVSGYQDIKSQPFFRLDYDGKPKGESADNDHYFETLLNRGLQAPLPPMNLRKKDPNANSNKTSLHRQTSTEEDGSARKPRLSCVVTGEDMTFSRNIRELREIFNQQRFREAQSPVAENSNGELQTESSAATGGPEDTEIREGENENEAEVEAGLLDDCEASKEPEAEIDP